MSYKLTRYASYLEKNNIVAVYSNFNLFFLKNETVGWFKKIISSEKIDEIPKDFIKLLRDKEVRELD